MKERRMGPRCEEIDLKGGNKTEEESEQVIFVKSFIDSHKKVKTHKKGGKNCFTKFILRWEGAEHSFT